VESQVGNKKLQLSAVLSAVQKVRKRGLTFKKGFGVCFSFGKLE